MGGDERFSAGAPIPSLARWGQSPDADLVYRAIVARGADTTARIADDLGLGRQRVRDALGELQAINAVTLDRRQQWRSRPPAEVIADLRRSRSRPFDRQEQHRRHRDLLQGLAPDHNTVLGYGIQHLPTRQAARDRLAALVAIERHEHLAMNIEQTMDVEVAQAALPIHQVLHARGVPTRTIGPPPLDGDQLRPEIRELGRLRMESRDSLDVPLKLFVIDRRVALFPLVPHDHDRGFLEISQPPLVEALLAQFERHWAMAIDPQEHRMPQTALTAREQNLVALLAQGHTDASAARELRIGVRSVTKIIRGLMDRLQVENRFQLGLALGILRAAHLPSPRPTHASTERR